MNKTYMTAIFELHIHLPHIPPSVGHKYDKERKSSQIFFFTVFGPVLRQKKKRYMLPVFEMEILRSPLSPTVFSYSTVRGSRVDSFDSIVPITNITGSCGISL